MKIERNIFFMNAIKIIFKIIYAIIILYYIWCILFIYTKLNNPDKNYKRNNAIKIIILASALIIMFSRHY